MKVSNSFDFQLRIIRQRPEEERKAGEEGTREGGKATEGGREEEISRRETAEG